MFNKPFFRNSPTGSTLAAGSLSTHGSASDNWEARWTGAPGRREASEPSADRKRWKRLIQRRYMSLKARKRR